MAFYQIHYMSTGLFELISYFGILFVVYHLYKINDHTMQLAMQIETIRENYLRNLKELESME